MLLFERFLFHTGKEGGMRIKITAVEEKAGKTGGMFKKVTTEDGMVYFLFDMGLAEHLKLGAYVDVEIEQKGNYKHITSAVPATGPASVSGAQVHGSDGVTIRLACLQSASMIASAKIQVQGDISLGWLLEIASGMEKWALTGVVAGKPKAAPPPAEGQPNGSSRQKLLTDCVEGFKLLGIKGQEQVKWLEKYEAKSLTALSDEKLQALLKEISQDIDKEAAE